MTTSNQRRFRRALHFTSASGESQTSRENGTGLRARDLKLHAQKCRRAQYSSHQRAFHILSALLMLDKIRFVQYVLEINNKAVEEPGESEKNWR